MNYFNKRFLDLARPIHFGVASYFILLKPDKGVSRLTKPFFARRKAKRLLEAVSISVLVIFSPLRMKCSARYSAGVTSRVLLNSLRRLVLFVVQTLNNSGSELFGIRVRIKKATSSLPLAIPIASVRGLLIKGTAFNRAISLLETSRNPVFSVITKYYSEVV